MRHAYVKRVVASVTGSRSKMIDTGSVELAVDVGGASGALIHFLMKQNPALRGALLDLPENAAEAAT
jgi:hypothetical protein